MRLKYKTISWCVFCVNMHHSTDMCGFNPDLVMYGGNAQKSTKKVDVELTPQPVVDKVADNLRKFEYSKHVVTEKVKEILPPSSLQR